MNPTVNIITARPSRWEGVSDEDIELYAQTVRAGVPLPPIREGSVDKPCEMCGVDVSVGPMLQAQIGVFEDRGEKYKILCILDAVRDSKQHGHIELRDLGND